MVVMDTVEMFHPPFQDSGDPSNTYKQDSLDSSTPELNGGNGIEINWDKYEVSYDCPRCLKRMLKKPYHQGLMWANHFTPIFNHTSTHLNTTEDDDDPLEHISTCAFFHFQSPVSHFDFDYLDAIEKKDLLKDFVKDPKCEMKSSSGYASECSDDAFSSEDHIDVESVEPLCHKLNFLLHDNMQHNNNDDDDDDIFSTFHKNNNIINNNILNNKNNIISNNKCSKSDKRNDVMTWPKMCDDDSSSCSSSGGNSINSSKSSSSDDGSDAPLDRRLTICEMHNYCSNKQNISSKYSQKSTQDDAYKDADYDVVDDGFDEFVTLSDSNLYDIDEKENDYNNYNNVYNNNDNKQNIEKYRQDEEDVDDDNFKRNNSHNYNNEKFLNRKTYNNLRSRPHPYKTSPQKSPSSPSRPRRRPRSPTYHPTFRGRKGIYRKSEETSRRAQHNSLERQRRNNLKDLFFALKDTLPSVHSSSSFKFTKVNTLVNAVSYIQRLHKDAVLIEKQLQSLKKQQQSLMQLVNS